MSREDAPKDCGVQPGSVPTAPGTFSTRMLTDGGSGAYSEEEDENGAATKSFDEEDKHPTRARGVPHKETGHRDERTTKTLVGRHNNMRFPSNHRGARIR